MPLLRRSCELRRGAGLTILEIMTVHWLFRFRRFREPQIQRLRWLVVLYAVLGAVVAFFLGILFLIGIVLRARTA
jgi:hypothetical protein